MYSGMLEGRLKLSVRAAQDISWEQTLTVSVNTGEDTSVSNIKNPCLTFLGSS